MGQVGSPVGPVVEGMVNRKPNSQAMAGAAVAFLLVGGMAAVGYKYFQGKMQRIEEMTQRMDALGVAKEDVESVLARINKRLEALEYGDEYVEGARGGGGGDECMSEISEFSQPSQDGGGDQDEGDEITFLRPRPVKKSKKSENGGGQS